MKRLEYKVILADNWNDTDEENTNALTEILLDSWDTATVELLSSTTLPADADENKQENKEKQN